MASAEQGLKPPAIRRGFSESSNPRALTGVDAYLVLDGLRGIIYYQNGIGSLVQGGEPAGFAPYFCKFLNYNYLRGCC